MSMLCCLASLTPPTAAVGRSAVLATGYDGAYGEVLKRSMVPWLIIAAISMLTIVFANQLSVWF